MSKTWTDRRKGVALQTGPAGAMIEFVPGGPTGERAYFWIGSGGQHYATIDARKLARFVDGLRADVEVVV